MGGGDTDLWGVLAAGGPWGLVALTVVSIIRGWLIPRSVVEDVRAELAYMRARLRELELARDVLASESARLGTAVTEAVSSPRRGAPPEVVS